MAKKHFMTLKHWSLTAISTVLASTMLVACGGGGSDSPEQNQQQDEEQFKTNFTLSVSDAPVDNASEVVVFFDHVELVGNGDTVDIDVTDSAGDPRRIDLLTLQGEQFANIVTDEEIPAGQYSQVRLSITDESYIVMNDGTFPISVPSGELKLDGFEALQGADEAYTIEFDLRKSLVNPQGQNGVFLKPRGVRLVKNDEVGVLKGSVDVAVLDDAVCAEKVAPRAGNAVYLYEQAGLTAAGLSDDADNAQQDKRLPFTVATVADSSDTDALTFNIGFVPAGDYTLAFSCEAYLDEPESNEDIRFQVIQDVTVQAQQTETVVLN